MAKKLKEFPATRTNRRFDTRWLDGGIWQLTAGVDYSCQTTSIRSSFTRYCTSAGGKSKTAIVPSRDGEPERLIVQFVRRRGKKKPETPVAPEP